MKTLVVATLTAFVVAAVGGCSGTEESTASGAPSGSERTEDSAVPAPKAPDAPSPESGDTAFVDSEACEEVRNGIDAFNEGQFDVTVEHFELAVPLAEEQDDGSELSTQFVEAVRYYAELDEELYPEAARSSPEFAKYKAITLGLCLPVGEETTESPGTEI